MKARQLPPMPEIGRPESYYAKLSHEADKLADLVRQHAGYEALRLASTEDDLYAARVSMGQNREKIEDEAEVFFGRLLSRTDVCPDWFNESDWAQLKMIRDQWI